MKWKTILQVIALITTISALFFLGLTFYHKYAIAPTIETAIKEQTYKIEQSFDQKFKKLDNLNFTQPVSADMPILNPGHDSVVVSKSDLNNRQKRKYKVK